jgi:O-antigen ligase
MKLSPQTLYRQSTIWTLGSIITLTVLAPALGGSTELWAQALISFGTGILFFLAPPRRSLGFLPNCLFIAIGAAALIGFLPAHWFSPPAWRTALLNFGIQLPATRSPQPWPTIQAACLFWLGLAWAYYLFACQWPPAFREKAWDAYCFALLCLAATLAFCFAINKHLPFWPDVREFGFFPNRNQTSNVLGLAGIMIYANAFQHLRRGRKSGWIWLASLALICWALILNYSRAGIILFFGGALIWHFWWLKGLKERLPRMLAFGPLVLLLALLLVAGGETMWRFGKESAGFFSSGNFRLSIYRDALHLLEQSPLLGIGLGNFRSIFSLHRQFSFAPNETIHPESDWLWTAVEMGFLVSLLFFILLVWWIRHCFPFEPGTWRRLRMAAMICGCAFVVHGFFDVSGHRVGAIWPALFLASSALHPEVDFRRSQTTAVLFRFLGALFVTVAAWWSASIFGAKTLPTTASLDRVVAQIQVASQREDYEKVLQLVSQDLNIAPLNWELYYQRGFAEAALDRPRSQTSRDFAVARYLLPNWPDLYLKEGKVWLAVGEPDLAFESWRQGMERFPPEAPHLYSQMFEIIKGDVALLDRWRILGETNKECLLIFLRSTDRMGFEIELERLLSEDRQPRNDRGSRTLSELDSFSRAELGALFSAWYEKGDKLRLAQTLREHSDWQEIAWPQLARAYADYQDYRQAYETVQQFASSPHVPQKNPQESAAVLQSRFKLNPTVEAGLALYFAETKENRIDDALMTLRQLAALPNSPKYLSYLEAQLWAKKGQWKEAWQALARFEFPNG